MGRIWRGRPVSVRLTPSANENLQVILLTGVGGGGSESRRKPKKKSKMKSCRSRKVQDEKWHEEARNESGSQADRR